MKNCRYFNRCEAPICPLNKNVKSAVWYPDEGICKLYRNRQYIKTQKKIAKKTRNRDTFYTFDMLNKNIRVTSAIDGLNPDKDIEEQVERWNKAHPEITEEELKALSERAKVVLGAHKKEAIHDERSEKLSIPNRKNKVG